MDTFAVIGLGRFGYRLATALAEAGAEVIAIDRRRDLVENIRDHVTVAVCLDSTDEQALRSQGVEKVNVAVVGMGTNFEAAALTTILLKHMGVPRVLARAPTAIRAQILSRIGADDAVNPEEESADRWCNRLLTPAIMQQIELAEDHSFAQFAAPRAFHGKTLKDLDVRRKYSVNVVAIRRKVEQTDPQGHKTRRITVISVPAGETIVEPEDVLLLIGRNDAIATFPAE
ncbi:MAG TPA: TrkA family potassium uptake protein [Phycisphaerae bacterium]|nr:TrkA family potassium uptake protein [Phycisphaerae bacterium]